MKTDIMVSGSTGFVGRNLTPFLEKEGWMVIPLSRKQNTKITVTYNALSKNDFDNIRAFIHLAGKAHDLKNTSLDEEYYEVNTELTKLLFDLFLESNCKTFIYFSSVKAVADQVEGILTEEHPYQPKTVYGKSKALAEQYLLSKELPKDKRLYILRPCMIHGPNNKGNLNLLYSFVSKGIPYPFGKYQNKRSFVSVENLCFIINKLINNSKIESGIYNIADDASLSTIDLVKVMGNVLKKPLRILNVPKTFVNVLAKIGDALPIPFNSERLQKLTENYEVSNDKIKNELGIKNLPIHTEKGLINTIKSYEND
jgi:nucleoside-diphosphate-sugar epimerase